MSKQRSSSQSTSGRTTQSSSTQPSSTRTTQGQTGGGGTTIEETFVQTGGSSATQARPVTEQARAVTEQAKDLAGQVQDKATQKVESGLAKGKSQIAESLHALNQSLLISGQQLRDRNQQNVSRYVDQLAGRVERAASYLQTTDISEIVDRTENFARRRPAVFLGGAFVLGLIGARFLKSSARAGGGQRAAGGGEWAPGYTRGRTPRIGDDLSAPSAREEWASLRTAVTRPELADLPSAGVPTQPLGESGLGRQRSPLDDYDETISSPDASRR